MLVLSGCSEVKSDTKDEEQIVLIPVVAEPVTVGEIDAAYSTTASLEAAAEADVSARVSGVVTHLYVEEGDYVEAGQVLAQLEIDKLDLELRKATAKLNQLVNDLKRNKEIFEKDLVSSEAYDRIKYQFEAQQAATGIAKLNLDNATIRAPISGVISNRYIKLGNLLEQNASAFHISDLSELQAILHIPESEKASLAVDQPASIMVEASAHPFLGKIKRISPIVDKESGTVRVTVSLKDKTAVLRPGMFSRVSVIYDTHQEVILVPKNSILSQDDEVSVYVVKDGIAYKRIVSTGFSNSQYVEIISGVEVNDMIITTGQRNLKNEANVEIISAVAHL